MEKKKQKKSHAKKETTEILKVLIPKQLKKANENWCGTVSGKKERKRLETWI